MVVDNMEHVHSVCVTNYILQETSGEEILTSLCTEPVNFDKVMKMHRTVCHTEVIKLIIVRKSLMECFKVI